MATKQQGYHAHPIRPSLQGRKEGRKEGGREGVCVCVCVWKGPTANEGNKEGKVKNRRKSSFKEDIP
jgi:hypothetical protein